MKEGAKTAIRSPKGLDVTGKRLWREVTGRYELRPDELHILASACKTADMIDRLEGTMATQDPVVPGSRGQEIAHPLLAEIRMQRVTFSSLLKAMKLPDDGGVGRNQQRDAATSRWAQAYGKA